MKIFYSIIFISSIQFVFSHNFIRSLNYSTHNQKVLLTKINAYTDWLLGNSPFFLKDRFIYGNKSNSETNGLQCLDIVFDLSEHKKFEKYFLHNIFNRSDITIRFRNHIDIKFEPFYCNFFIAFQINPLKVFDNIRFYGTLIKSQYFIVVIPEEPLKYYTSISKHILKIQKWPVHIFTHEHVVVIINRKIYLLSHPYRRENREFKRIDEKLFRTWDWIDRNVSCGDSGFNGKHLKVATIDCPPMFRWESKLRPTKINYPKASDWEWVCNFNGMDDGDCSELRNCGGILTKYLLFLSYFSKT